MRRHVVRLFRLLAVISVTAVFAAVPVSAEGDDESGNSGSDPQGVPAGSLAGTDDELIQSIEAVGLLDDWLSIGTVDPRSKLVNVTGGDIAAIRASVIELSAELVALRPVGDELLALLDQLDEIDVQLAAERSHLEAEAAVTALALGVIDDALTDAAVASYIRGRGRAPTGDDLEAVYTDATRATIVDVAVEELLQRHIELESLLDRLHLEIGAVVDAQLVSAETREASQAELDAMVPRWDELESLVPETLAALGLEKMGGTVVGLDLPLVTVDAYLTGEAVTAERHPECGLRWQAIAAIGRVESNHGRNGNGWVMPDGRLSAPFLGMVLDGSVEGTQLVTDTDGGALDGDAAYDRAVGPFQFLPRSWRSGGVDGNGDGVIDVNSLYDGAAAVGEYLCSRLSPLDTDSALRQSFLFYNFSGAYADHVLGWVHTYDQFTIAPAPSGDDGLASGD